MYHHTRPLALLHTSTARAPRESNMTIAAQLSDVHWIAVERARVAPIVCTECRGRGHIPRPTNFKLDIGHRWAWTLSRWCVASAPVWTAPLIRFVEIWRLSILSHMYLFQEIHLYWNRCPVFKFHTFRTAIFSIIFLDVQELRYFRNRGLIRNMYGMRAKRVNITLDRLQCVTSYTEV